MILKAVENTKDIYHTTKLLYYKRKNIDLKVNPKAQVIALKEHLARVGLKAEVSPSKKLKEAVYDINYEINGNPLVSIIIPNKDHVFDLYRCISSIQKSSYKNYEIIIVENNSKEDLTFRYYEELQAFDNIKILKYSDEFNYSAINNFAAKHASGEYLILLNNDVEVISEDWIEQLLMFAQREDVGCVGAKLYYPNETIQHGGVVVAFKGVAGHAGMQCNRNDAGYYGRLCYVNNQLAVTAACLMLSKKIFNEVGGLNEQDLKICFNDVDLCLKVYETGYLNVFNPLCELYHYESISRGEDKDEKSVKRFQGEVQYFLKKWTKYTKGHKDPFYNPNLNYGDLQNRTYIAQFKPYEFDFDSI